jgi:hypothetical protein
MQIKRVNVYNDGLEINVSNDLKSLSMNMKGTIFGKDFNIFLSDDEIKGLEEVIKEYKKINE